jgi:hypothetical protein
VEQGKMQPEKYMHTSMYGAAIRMFADACLTKRLKLGFSDFAAGSPPDPNSLNLRVYRSANYKLNGEKFLNLYGRSMKYN